MENGTVGALRGIVEHRSARGVAHTIEKINRYSTIQAEDMATRGKWPVFLRLRLIAEFPAARINIMMEVRFAADRDSGMPVEHVAQ